MPAHLALLRGCWTKRPGLPKQRSARPDTRADGQGHRRPLCGSTGTISGTWRSWFWDLPMPPEPRGLRGRRGGLGSREAHQQNGNLEVWAKDARDPRELWDYSPRTPGRCNVSYQIHQWQQIWSRESTQNFAHVFIAVCHRLWAKAPGLLMFTGNSSYYARQATR